MAQMPDAKKGFRAAAGLIPTPEEQALGQKLLKELSEFRPDRKKVMQLIEAGAYLEEKDARGNTPMMRAAYLGFDAEITAMAQRGAEIDIVDIDGYTPVMWATAQMHHKALQALVDAQAMLNIQAEIMPDQPKNPAYDEEEFPPPATGTLNNALMIAAYQGDLKSVEILIKANAWLDLQNADGSTALILAAYRGHTEIVRALIKAGALMDEKDNKGCTALMWAAFEGHEEIVDVLVDELADVNIQDNDLATALFFAAEKGHKKIVRKLLSRRANPKVRDMGNGTAYDIAQKNGHYEVADIIRQSEQIYRDLGYGSFRRTGPSPNG